MNPVSAFNTEEKQFVMYSNGTPTWYPVQFHVFFMAFQGNRCLFCLVMFVYVLLFIVLGVGSISLSLLGLTALKVNQEILFYHNQRCASKCLTARSLNKLARVHV